MNNHESGPDLKFTPQDHRSVEPYPTYRSEQQFHPSRTEQEAKIKQSGKLKRIIIGALAVAGLAVGVGALVNAESQNSANMFEKNQADNVAASIVLSENNIGSDDIEFGENSMEFDLNGNHYNLEVDVAEFDNRGIYNLDGGIYQGTVVSEYNDKTITKTFRATDNADNNSSYQSGVSIDEAMAMLGYDSSQTSQNVVE